MRRFVKAGAWGFFVLESLLIQGLPPGRIGSAVDPVAVPVH